MANNKAVAKPSFFMIFTILLQKMYNRNVLYCNNLLSQSDLKSLFFCAKSLY